MTINIDITTHPDLDSLSALHNACFDHGWTPSDLAEMLRIHDTIAFVASCQPSRLAGFALLRTIETEGEILTLAVSPALRRLGTGTAIIDAVCAHATKTVRQSLFLEVRPSNKPAIALYEKAGFTALSLRKNYYLNTDGSSEHALILRKNL